ncbi:hypothetical protein LLH03_18760 [bacterium]|nr:hypothetical protein [bacterium]
MFQLGGAVIRKLDSNGRTVIPDVLLQVYPRKLVLAPGFDNCIRAYAPKTWDGFMRRLAQQDMDDPDVADFVRFFASMTCEVDLDGNGRLRFPDALLKWAGFDDEKREVQFFDAGDYIEFWEAESFRQFMSAKSVTFKELARKLFGKQASEGTANVAGAPAGNGE